MTHHFAYYPRMDKLDEFDRKILRLVQENARQTTEALGDAVGLSATAIQRRLKRLRDSGTIRKEVAVVDPAFSGGLITLIVQVTLAKGSGRSVDEFKRRMRRLPEIQQCYYTMGEADFVLIATAPSVSDFEAFTRRAFFDDPAIAHFTTSVAMETVKTGLDVPI